MNAKNRMYTGIAALCFGVIAIIGGVVLFSSDSDTVENSAQESSQTEATTQQQATATPTVQQPVATATTPTAQEAAPSAPEEPATETPDTTAQPSRFITLAEYNADQAAYADQNKVLFFHASWCSICKGIENDINSDPTQIPSNTTFILTDYDSETALRQTHGVTYQFTFVQIDNTGSQIAKWSATNLDKAIAGVQS